MAKKTIVLTALLAGVLLLPFQHTTAQSDKTMAETVVHLLSYVAMDYPGAVQNGEIINEQEFKEQQEFSQQAYDLTKTSSFLPAKVKSRLLQQMHRLIGRVKAKQPKDSISSIANRVNHRIIKITGLQTAPKVWPSLAEGKRLYRQNCAMCHGKNGQGDGPAGRALNPVPSNFHDSELMENFSPYQAYSSIRLGVPQTAMQGFTQLNDVQLWDLAFYVKSFRYQNAIKDSLFLRKIFKEILPKIGLSEVANLTDKELRDRINALSDKNVQPKLAALRTMVPKGAMAGNSLPTARKGLAAAVKSYVAGKKKLARTQAISAYLEGIEPVEARLRTIDADFVIQLETQMFNVRQAIEKDRGADALKKQVSQANTLIDKAHKMLQGQKLNYWVTFIIALTIMLREALEAFLILFVVLALIRSAHAKKALPWLHGGWIAAVACGIVGWFLADYIIQFGGRNREVLEGLVSLLAVIILVFAGFWLHDKTYAEKWTKFVNEKIGGYLKKDRMIGLAAFSFMVVFREAFEVILFLQALSLEASPQNQSAIGFGAAGALVIIAIIAYLFMQSTKKVPIKYIFKYSSWVIVLLAIILTGKAVHALQEAGWISHTQVTHMFRFEWLGIYPNVQSLLGQLLLIVLIIAAYFINKRRHKKLALKKAA